MQNQKILCALDTGDLDAALALVRRLSPYVGGFKVGHGLTLSHGLDVLSRLRDAGAQRVFLDLKFHDIPHSVALAVREAARRGVWMLTVHASGGSEMLRAAASEADAYGETAPLVVGVSILTSIEPNVLRDELGVTRSLADQAASLSSLAIQSGLDGIVCSPHEVRAIRQKIGPEAAIVTPGIRSPGGESHDQKRIGSATQALADGADYLVIGRALTEADEIETALHGLGLLSTTPGSA